MSVDDLEPVCGCMGCTEPREEIVEIPGEEPTGTETTNGSSGRAPPMGPVGGGGSSCSTMLFTDTCWPDISGFIDGILEGITDKIPLI